MTDEPRWPQRTTDLPSSVYYDNDFRFFLDFTIPGLAHGYRDGDLHNLTISTPDGSHAHVGPEGDLTQSGPRRLWDDIETIHQTWRALGTPPRERFGLTVTPQHHTPQHQAIWLDTRQQPSMAGGLTSPLPATVTCIHVALPRVVRTATSIHVAVWGLPTATSIHVALPRVARTATSIHVTGEVVVSGELAAAVLVVLVAGALALVGVTARWVVGHPERIRAGLAWVADRPAVAWVRARYPRQWRFLGRRFAPGEAAGLTLTLGVAAVLALGVGFGEVLDNVLDGEGIAVADLPVVWFLAAHRQPWSINAALVITDMGSPEGAAVTAVVAGVALAWVRRSWLPLLVFALGAGGIGVINMTVKWLVGRDRPPLATAVLGEQGFSFPSGHTVSTTVVWLLSAWMIGYWAIGWRAVRVAVWTGALLMIVAVGVTRVYLGVHFPSDVLAGWALGAAWAVTIALVVNVWEQSLRTLTAPVGPTTIGSTTTDTGG